MGRCSSVKIYPIHVINANHLLNRFGIHEQLKIGQDVYNDNKSVSTANKSALWSPASEIRTRDPNGFTIVIGDCIYVHFYTLSHYVKYNTWVFFLGSLLYIFPVYEWFCHYTFILSSYVLIFMWIIYLFLHWNVFYFVQYTHWLYFILIILFCISSVHWLFYQYIDVKTSLVLFCLCILYQFLLQYVCVFYRIYWLVGIQIGNLVVYIYLFSFTVSILVDLHSQYCINTYLFGFTI